MGRSADEAEKMLNEQNIGFEYDSNYVYSDAYPRDTVVSQSVTPGTIVDKNSTIKLTISKGAEKIQIPSGIIGSKADDGVKKLDALGLKTEISYEYSDRTIGMVISCSPGEKASVFRSDVIKLVVSRGREKSEEKVYTIPSLVGLKQSKAQAKIASSGFSVGEVREEYNDKVEKGAVIRQTVKAGGKAPQGLSIGLVVSKGSESEEKYKATYTFALDFPTPIIPLLLRIIMTRNPKITIVGIKLINIDKKVSIGSSGSCSNAILLLIRRFTSS